jgi:hypothetical protein
MSDEERGRDPAKNQDQMEDQGEFHEDPREQHEVAEQQPETQPGGGGGASGRPSRGEDEDRGEAGRDDAGEASGNPPNAG